MTLLEDTKVESFCRKRAKPGARDVSAYTAAKYKAKKVASAAGCPRPNSRDAKVVARIAEIEAEALPVAVMTREEVLQELSHIARSNIQDVLQSGGSIVKVDRDEITGKRKIVTVRNDGIQFVDLSKLDRSITAAIREVTQSANGSPSIKFYSKLHALYLLGKHYGLFANENSKPNERNDRDIAEALTAALKRVEEMDARDRRSH